MDLYDVAIVVRPVVRAKDYEDALRIADALEDRASGAVNNDGVLIVGTASKVVEVNRINAPEAAKDREAYALAVATGRLPEKGPRR
jgi:hypothetical protein